MAFIRKLIGDVMIDEATGALLVGIGALPTGAATAAKQDTANTSLGRIEPAANAATVTPHDENVLAHAATALYIGTGGNIKVGMNGGQTLTFANVPDGTILPIRVNLVFDTDTTAADIVALY